MSSTLFLVMFSYRNKDHNISVENMDKYRGVMDYLDCD
jgi:hypothetical protein